MYLLLNLNSEYNGNVYIYVLLFLRCWCHSCFLYPFFVLIDSILRLDGNDIKCVPFLVLQRQCGMHEEWVCEKVDLEVARIVCETVDALVSKILFQLCCIGWWKSSTNLAGSSGIESRTSAGCRCRCLFFAVLVASEIFGRLSSACCVLAGCRLSFLWKLRLQLFSLIKTKQLYVLNLTITNWRLFWSLHVKPPRILGGHSKK